METAEKIARYKEIERRGLLDKLPPEKQAAWAEIKKRGLDGEKPQSPYSAGDKVKYGLRAAAEGLTFDLGDIAAGATNIIAKPLGTLSGAAFGGGKVSASDFNPVRSFKEGRRGFINEQNEFKKYHPALNFGGELTGGLITGGFGAGKKIAQTAAKQGIKQLAKQGVKEGAKFGAAYGAGSGLTEDPEKLSVPGALFGAGTGALAGGVLGAPFSIGGYYGVKGIGKTADKAGQFINRLKNKEIYAVDKAAGADMAKSIEQNKPLIDFANEGTLDLALGTKQADPKAAQIYRDYGRERLSGQRQIINNMLGETFGKKASSELLQELEQTANRQAKPLYDKAMYAVDEAGNILKDETGKDIGRLVDINKLNRYELDRIQKVYNTKGVQYEVKDLPANDMRVLNYAKQLMDDDIGSALARGEKNQARILQNLRNDFVQKLDDLNPDYAPARKVIERRERAKEALDAGKNFAKGRRENMLFDFNRLNDEEKHFFRLGAGDKIAEHTNTKTEGGNISQRVFDAETLKRLKLMGVKNYEALAQKAKEEKITAGNLARLLQGSQTAEKQASVGRWAVSPVRQTKGLIARVIDSTVGKIVQPNPEKVAQILTDPKLLKEMRHKAMQGDIDLAKKIGHEYLQSGKITGFLAGKGWNVVKKTKQHLLRSPNYETYIDIDKIPQLYKNATEIKNAPNWKNRTDNYVSWDYYLAKDGDKYKLITVGNKDMKNGTIRKDLYNLNHDVVDFAWKHPEFMKKVAASIDRASTPISIPNGHILSIADIMKEVNSKKGLSYKDRKLLKEILKEGKYKIPVIYEQSKKEGNNGI